MGYLENASWQQGARCREGRWISRDPDFPHPHPQPRGQLWPWPASVWAGPWLPKAPPVPTQSSACTLASVVSGKFSCLLQALKMRRDLALRDIEVAKTQALAQAQEEEQRLRGHLEAMTLSDHRIRNVLEQPDDQTFLQVPGLRATSRGASVPAPCAGAYGSCHRCSGITAPHAPWPTQATDSSTLG